MNGESVGVIFDGTVALDDGQPVIASTERLSVHMCREEVSVAFDGTDLIVNGEAVHVSETAGGSARYTVVEGDSI